MLMLTQCESQKNKHQGQKPLIEQIFLLKFLQHPIIPFLVEAEKYRIDWLICLPNSLSACTWAIYMIQVEWLKQFCAINFWEKNVCLIEKLISCFINLYRAFISFLWSLRKTTGIALIILNRYGFIQHNLTCSVTEFINSASIVIGIFVNF